MSDYQRGLLRAAEICDEMFADHFNHSQNKVGAQDCAAAIRAEAEKNADGHPQVNAGDGTTGESQQAGCKGVPSAPDEALIEEIASESYEAWLSNNLTMSEQIAVAIREYLKRREHA